MTRDAPYDAPGDYVGGRFLRPEGAPLTSHDPAHEARIVFSTAESVERVGLAVEHAREAQPGWLALGLDGRWKALTRFRAAIEQHREPIADAIVREMGKVRSEARLEVSSLVGRFELALDRVKNDLREGPLPGFPGEALRWQPHGVVGVIGPFNFPVHLSHAHVVPALLLGNTVVLKPSEITPLAAVRYLEAAHAAGLPPGVLNLVQGRAASGMALVAHHDVKAIAFTGSWPVGRRILEATLDQPETLLALEMGGKNVSVVCEDADLRQAAHEIVVGGYLTTGQRCTCTDRVLVHKSKAKALVDALARLVRGLHFGDPDDPRSFAGPMATEAGVAKLERALEAARSAGADAIVPGARKPGGSFRTGSLHLLPSGVHDVPGYTDVELFGPDLGVEVVESDEEAISIVASSPYGFACSVFTGKDERFERYRARIRLGLLNRNRSTNQASPRLPFGGTGRSGNFRPAGSFAARNLAVPVAVQSNPLFAILPSAHLRAALPAPDLDLMEQRHVLEESQEAAEHLAQRPRPMRIVRPEGGALPASTAWLERLHAGDRIPRGAAPLVEDPLRSEGPYVVTVDEPPLAVIDAARGTGANDPALVRAYVEGTFGDAALHADAGAGAAAEAYAMALRALVPGPSTVAFAEDGHAAVEKALALARASAPPDARRIVVFAGGQHGRWRVPEHGPFVLAGHEAVVVPWPARDEGEPDDPLPLRLAAARGDLDALARLGEGADPELAAELGSLRAVGAALSAGEAFAVLVEPVQSAGERGASARFHRALHLLCKAFGVAHLMDETEHGFGVAGPFVLHQRFGLRDAAGAPSVPDAIVLGGPAQLGVLLTRFADPEPSEALAASLVRGRLLAGLAAEREGEVARIERLLAIVRDALVRRWPHLARHPRVRGTVLAFDLPSPAHVRAYLGQARFRGVLATAAGERTVRYRLHARFGEREIERLGAAIHQSLAWLEAHPGKQPPPWEDLEPHHAAESDGTIRLRVAAAAEAEALLPAIEALEAAAGDPSRRDRLPLLALGFGARGLVVVAEETVQERPVLRGHAVAAPLEAVPALPGPDRDPARGRGDTLHLVALTVDPAAKGGIARRLELALVEAARPRREGVGHRWITVLRPPSDELSVSRTHDGLGAYPLFHLERPGGEPGSVTHYDRVPVRRLAADDPPGARPNGAIDCAVGLVRPLAEPPGSLVDAERAGLLSGAIVSGCAWPRRVTRQLVRALEWIGALAPDLPHLVATSGRDGLVDELVRILGAARPGARTVIALRGGYVGHTTAAARSVSDPHVHRAGPGAHDWPHLPHPAEVGDAAALEGIRQAIAARGAPTILGIVVETVGERTGWVTSDAFLEGLGRLRSELDVPVALVETASAYHRSGRGAFHASAAPILPDALLWWTGGQLGLLHLAASLGAHAASVAEADELSAIQAHHQLRVTRGLDVASAGAELGAVLETAASRYGMTLAGAGLYRVLAGEHASELDVKLSAGGVRVRRYGDRVVVAPPLDRADEAIARLRAALG